MRAERVTYRRLKSFGRYESEGFSVVLTVEDGEDVDEVLDAARLMVGEALDRAQAERDKADPLRPEDLAWESERPIVETCAEDSDKVPF